MGGNLPSQWTHLQVYIQTQEFSTGMVGTPHNEHSRCADLGLFLSTGMVETPHFHWETAGVQTQEFSTGMVGTPPNLQSQV
ncbi:unnamed protein product, partial [Staurois parvus]